MASAALVRFPAQEPFAVESVVLSFALLYGFGVWPVARTVATMVAFGAVAALVMYPRARVGDLPTSELVEVFAPIALAGVVIFHVRRRADAVRRERLLAEANRRRSHARDRLSRMTSHELRTPLTIATAYVDQLLMGEPAGRQRGDLETVREELTHLARVSERLVRAVALDLGAPEGATDVRAVLEEVRRRWDVVVDRDLVVVAEAHTVPINADRLRAALDTLVENSVRYTLPGQRVCLFSCAVAGHVEVGVADAGSGMSPELTARINRTADAPPDLGDGADALDDRSVMLRDMYSQTGFGLRLVAGIARSAGGHLVASTSDLGGARVALSVPSRP